MKKTKIFILAGALTFAILGAFAKKPAKLFAIAAKAFAPGYGTIFAGATGGQLTNNNGGGVKHTAQFRTKGSSLGAWATMFTSSTLSNKVYR